MKTKDLEKEGITKEILKKLTAKNLGNPVQLEIDSDPVKLIKCMSGFWISKKGDIQKDKNGSYIVVKDENAIIARARYLLNFKGDILKEKINNEINRLKSLTDEKLNETLNAMRGCLVYAGIIQPEGFEQIAHGIMQGSSNLAFDTKEYEAKKEASKKIADSDFQKLYFDLKEQKDLGNEKDYDSLYIFFFQKGLPEIATFNHQDPNDLKTLVRFFHKDSIEKTIVDIKSKGHIYNVARFNIEKQNTLK